MSIKANDIFDDDALNRLQQVKEGLHDCYKEGLKLFESVTKVNVAANGDAPSKHKKALNDLTIAQQELQKITDQVAKAEAKQTQAYVDQQKALQKAKEELKQKAALGEKDAKAVKAQTASITELKAALEANRKAYASLRSEQERNSDEGKQLLAVIDEQDKAYKDLKASMGQHQDKVGDYAGATKALKDELKLARDEMAAIATRLGTDSPEFVTAAKRAGELKDQLNDINDAVKNTQASGIENVTNSFQMMAGQIKSGDLSGAAQSARQLAESMKNMSSKEIIAGLGGIGNAFKAIGTALITNPIFIIAGVLAGVFLLYQKFDGIAQEMSAKMVKRYENERKAMEDRYNLEIRLRQIAGKQTFDLERKKNEELIKSVDKQIEAGKLEINSFKSFLANMVGLRGEVFIESRKLTEDETNELLQIRKKASDEIILIDAEEKQFLKSQAEDLTKKLKEELDKRFQDEADFLIRKYELEAEAKQKQDDELNATIERLNTQMSWEEYVQSQINSYGQEHTETFLSQSELRQKRFEEEMLATQTLVNEASMAVQNALLSNENFVKALGKNALIFFINQIEKQLLAVQAKTIATATAEALAQPDSIATFGATGIARAAIIHGLIRAAFAGVRAQISRFEVGTGFAPGGLSIVGEKGPELIQSPSGRLTLSPDGPTLMNLERGSKVFTADETMKALAMSGIGMERTMASEQSGMIAIARIIKDENKKLIAAYQKAQPGNLYRQGSLVYEAKTDENGNRQLIRRSVMGK